MRSLLWPRTEKLGHRRPSFDRAGEPRRLRPDPARLAMSGREEFDWKQMRQEEDDYFATRTAAPRDFKEVGAAVMRKARQIEHRPDYEVEELARLKALPYREYLDTHHWKSRSGFARERDGHQC